MKKIILQLLFSLIVCLSSQAQMVYMPDSMFKVKLTNLGYGSCIVGDSIDSSCPQVANTTYLNLSTANISNLQGIQAFTSLRNLNCQFNNTPPLTIPALPPTLDTLNAHSCNLNFLPSLPPGLKYLLVQQNNLTSLPSLPSTLRYLNCGINTISSLPPLPHSIEKLDCNYNLLTALPALPDSLKDFDCSSNQITSISSFPDKIWNLHCWRNLLTSLPALPDSLLYLLCSENNLTSLPALTQNILSIQCHDNQLLSLPALPSGLIELNCGTNQLSLLPSLPGTLQFLNCEKNMLNSLPALPSIMRRLNISTNNFISFGQSLPVSLEEFYCDHNPLTQLPALPAPLNYLACSFTNLVSLPSLPPQLYNLICMYDSSLTSLPSLPDSMSYLVCAYNPNLFCLPELKKIDNLNFTNSPIGCLPNYGQVVSSTPSLGTLQLCDPFNPNNCNFYWNIGGKTFFDADSDCAQSYEPGLENIKVELYQGNNLLQQLITGDAGFFSFDVSNNGLYVVKVDTTNLPFEICPSGNSYLNNITAIDSLDYGDDFGLSCRNGFDLGAWSVYTSNLRPAHTTDVMIRAGDIANAFGVNCASGVSGSVNVVLGGPVHYVGPSPGALTPTTISGSSITYTISDFGQINSYGDFIFQIATDTTALSGSSVCIDVVVTSIAGDLNNLNNQLTNCFLVTASYDPNDKQVFPDGIIDTTVHWLTYTIRFQNTGTAAADNIYVIDTLSNDVDIQSFQLLAMSHPGFVQILENRIVRFNFPNINLPDSNSNEPLSHGYAQYKVKLNDNLPVGTSINNTAYIFFDFNPPVVTNTVNNTIDLPNGISAIATERPVTVFPVPFVNSFTLMGVKNSSFSIFDSFGKEILVGEMTNERMEINSESWPQGIYLIKVQNGRKLKTGKLIKK